MSETEPCLLGVEDGKGEVDYKGAGGNLGAGCTEQFHFHILIVVAKTYRAVSAKTHRSVQLKG